MAFTTTEDVPVDERCWADVPVIAGPPQPCKCRGVGPTGLCPDHATEIVGSPA